MTDDVLNQRTQGEIRYARDPRRRRDREHPCPHDASCHTPAHRREAMRGAHAGNRAGDRVGGADRNAEMRGDEQRDGGARFGAAAAEPSCSTRKTRSTLRGKERRSAHDNATVSSSASVRPITGAMTMNARVEIHFPGKSSAVKPAFATAAPP